MNKRIYFYIIGLLFFAISFFLDKNITNFFANNRIEFLDNLSILINNIEFYVFFGFVLLTFFLLGQKEKILPLTLTLILYLVATYSIKILVARPRPFTKFDFPDYGFYGDGVNQSFPSGHATATASALKFFEFKKIFFGFWIFVVLIVSFSRIYLGMHYLSDVVAGVIIGYSVSELSIFLVKKYKTEFLFTKNRKD